jgi:release factor glutamine methyltransferase
MSAERAAKLRQWQDSLYEGIDRDNGVTLDYLGMRLEVPPQVHPPSPQPELLGRALLVEVRETDRVLDMGTGSGVNAFLAASKSEDVVAVDNNPYAVECATANAARNGLASRIEVIEGNLFDAVEGAFDLIVFDPPFRWFAPRDLRETASTDENYRTLTTFFEQVDRYLAEQGRILIGFGSSGDLAYLHHLIRTAKMEMETLDSWGLTKDGLDVEYFAYRVTRRWI